MASSKTEIANQAISHLGVGKTIANIDSEVSQEARTCRVFYDSTLKLVLRDFSWPFAKTITSLNLIQTNPNDEWAYSYAYPSDCINFLRILSGIRNDTLQSKERFKVSSTVNGRIIYSDKYQAQGEYVRYITDTLLYPPDFELAFSLLLASFIAPRITGADPFKRGDKALANYERLINKAKANAYNEEVPDEEPESEFIRARS